MSLLGRIAPHMPYVRRYARALFGDQTSGDKYVRLVLESLAAGDVKLDTKYPPRVALYRVFSQYLRDANVFSPAQVRREAYLLVALEGFLKSEASIITGRSTDEIEREIIRATEAIDSHLRTNILILEGEPIIAADLKYIVESIGHSAVIANDRISALRLFDSNLFGIILSETQLADGATGIGTVRILLEKRNLPVIFITAFPERLLSDRFEPTFLITKPYQPETIKAAISQALFFDNAGSSRLATAIPGFDDLEAGVIETVDDFPSPIDFVLTSSNRIRASSSADNLPTKLGILDENDRLQRVQACRRLATRLLKSIIDRTNNVAAYYKDSLEEYAKYLPTKSRHGNMLLADAEIRSIREYLENDDGGIPGDFLSIIERLLEMHIALRAYYPEILRLYDDFHTGRIDRRLSLDDLVGIQSAIDDHPEIFDPSVSQQIGQLYSAPAENEFSESKADVKPLDPLGNISANDARVALYVGTINRLWKTFVAMGPVSKAFDGWRNVYDILAPHVGNILRLARTMAGM